MAGERNRAVFVSLLLAMLFISAAIYYLTPIIPPYAISLGASEALAGIAAGIAFIAAAIFNTPAGALSETYGRKTFILGGALVGIVGAVAYLAVSDPNLLIVARFLQGVALAMFLPAATAFVADVVEPEKIGSAVGLLVAFMSLGGVIGPTVGGYVAQSYGIYNVILLTIATSILAFLSLILLIPAKERRLEEKPEVSYSFPEKKKMFPFFTGMFILGVTGSGLVFMVIPYFSTEFGITPLQVGSITSAFFVLSMILNVPAGILSDKIGRRTVAVTGMILGALGLFLSSSTTDPVYLMATGAVIGAGVGLIVPASLAAAAECKNRGLVTGLMNSIMFAGLFVGPTVSGYLVTSLSYGGTAIALGVLTAIFIPVYLIKE